jgi:hypothetical protein
MSTTSTRQSQTIMGSQIQLQVRLLYVSSKGERRKDKAHRVQASDPVTRCTNHTFLPDGIQWGVSRRGHQRNTAVNRQIIAWTKSINGARRGNMIS